MSQSYPLWESRNGGLKREASWGEHGAGTLDITSSASARLHQKQHACSLEFWSLRRRSRLVIQCVWKCSVNCKSLCKWKCFYFPSQVFVDLTGVFGEFNSSWQLDAITKSAWVPPHSSRLFKWWRWHQVSQPDAQHPLPRWADQCDHTSCFACHAGTVCNSISIHAQII